MGMPMSNLWVAGSATDSAAARPGVLAVMGRMG